MLMPLRHAEGNSLIELLLAEGYWRGIHGADQLVVLSLFLRQQGCWLSGIKAKSFADGILVIGEVVHLLRDIGQEDFEAFIERNFVVAIFLKRRTRLLYNLLRLGGIPRAGLPQLGHMHVCGHVLVLFMVVAAPHGFRSGIQFALAAGCL